MTEYILTCNAGSDTLKCAIYTRDKAKLIQRIHIDRINSSPIISVTDEQENELLQKELSEPGYKTALSEVIHWLKDQAMTPLFAAGHRVVHGGKDYDHAVAIDEQVLQKLESFIPLAPLHQPYNLNLIKQLKAEFPDILQVACFDTAFHRDQPWLAQQFALPKPLVEEYKIYRYGFHGLSYQYIAQVLPEYVGPIEPLKMVIAHLGSGASMCALKNGKSFATTMGFSALEGLMMATRCGEIDPGVLLYLLQQKGMTPDQVSDLLYKQSGLLGVSQQSGDMRDLKKALPDANAKKAIDLFCYRAAREIGALIHLMGGLDVLVFTGGVGANDSELRANLCHSLNWLGAELDNKTNDANLRTISSASSAVSIYAIPTNEEQVIADETIGCLNSKE